MDSLLKILVVLVGIVAVSACDPENCKEIMFDGIEDQKAFSELVEFVSKSIENCQTPTDTSDVKVDISTTVAAKTIEAAVTGPGPGWNKSGDSFYKCFNNATMKYDDAKEVCEEYGGRLAAEVLRDPTAASFIAEECVKSDDRSRIPWVGCDDIAEEGVWEWSDGGDMNNETTSWVPGEPNNNGDEDCAHITRKTGTMLLLNDKECWGSDPNSLTTSWAGNEPNNNGNEDCAYITSKTETKVLLNDKDCSHSLTYICEV